MTSNQNSRTADVATYKSSAEFELTRAKQCLYRAKESIELVPKPDEREEILRAWNRVWEAADNLAAALKRN